MRLKSEIDNAIRNPQSAIRNRLSRRDWMKLSSASVVGYSMSRWFEALANDTVKNPQRKRSAILLWMSGGPSQMDTFDLKPGQPNGGPYKEIATAVPGIRISEHLPKIAKFMDHMAIVRSMSTKEGDHGRATYLMRTGNLPQGPIQYPSLGALVSRELGDPTSELPNFVSISPFRFGSPGAYGSGFLGPVNAPLVVGETSFPLQVASSYEQALRVQDLAAPAEVSSKQVDARIRLLAGLERHFAAQHPGVAPQSHQTAYDRAVRLMRTVGAKAFNLDEEPPALRDAYGRSLFGQGCLLARRLVERGVPFVEVSLGGVNGEPFGWDTHQQNFEAVERLSQVLDAAWATLMDDLKNRGLLQSTLIVWMGEFGRTPKINAQQGRDHFPNAWTTVLAGGDIRGGRVVGRTSLDGTIVEERLVSVADLLATVCGALGIDHLKQNMSNVGRPIRIVDKAARPITEIVS
jgi:Protein of unknown function (DUF1501)